MGQSMTSKHRNIEDFIKANAYFSMQNTNHPSIKESHKLKHRLQMLTKIKDSQSVYQSDYDNSRMHSL